MSDVLQPRSSLVAVVAELGQPPSARFTAAISSLTDTAPSPVVSNSAQVSTAAEPSAMFTPLISSSTVTVPLRLQSPAHDSGAGVGDGVGLSLAVLAAVAVAVGVSVGSATVEVSIGLAVAVLDWVASMVGLRVGVLV
ncbi:MAG: hypothetical protein SF182_07020 [Deltaproteobacteria bacterium]|nr:hypothetical protein [Deltaproteobacteria bacterium]